MSDARERERRRWYLERFLEHTDSGRVGDELSSESAGTDLLVQAAGDPVGVRVVELLHPPGGSVLRESVRAFRSAVGKAAEREWVEREDRPHVEVWVEFSAHEQTTASRNREELARRLCDLVDSALPDTGGFARIVAGRGEDEASFPLVAPIVTVARLPTYSGTSWHAVSGAGRVGLDVDGVKQAVDRASSTGEGGFDDAGERWLVAVVESYRYPSVETLSDEVTKERYPSTFDRVWLYDPATNEVHELKT